MAKTQGRRARSRQGLSAMTEGLRIDWEEVAKLPDMTHVLRAMPAERLVEALLEKLPPEQAQELLRRQAKKEPPKPAESSDAGEDA